MMDIQEKVELLKKELLNKYINDYKFLYQWDDGYDEKLALPYAERCLNAFLKLEGPDRLFKSKETCDGISLTPYLDKIRNLDEEACLLIAIKNNQVIETKLFTSDRTGIITVDDYIKNDVFELLAKWRENNYKVLNYHNHPNRISARPSNTDIINNSLPSTENPVILQQLKKYNLTKFDYYDWGIVTEFDFYSEVQEDQAGDLYFEYMQTEAELIAVSKNKKQPLEINCKCSVDEGKNKINKDTKIDHDKCVILESMYAYDNGGIESGNRKLIFVFFEKYDDSFKCYNKYLLKIDITSNFYKLSKVVDKFWYILELDDDLEKEKNYYNLLSDLLNTKKYDKLNRNGVVREWCPDKNRFISIGAFQKKDLPENLFKGILDEETYGILYHKIPNQLSIYDTQDVSGKILKLIPSFFINYYKENFMTDSFCKVDENNSKIWDGKSYQKF